METMIVELLIAAVPADTIVVIMSNCLDLYSFCCAAGFAGVGLHTILGTGSLLDHLAVIPIVALRLDLFDIGLMAVLALKAHHTGFGAGRLFKRRCAV